MNTRTAVLVASFAIACCVAGAGADVIRTPGGLSDAPSIQTFEAMGMGVLSNTYSTGGMTFSSATGLAITNISSYPANGTAVTNQVLQPVATTNIGPGSFYGSMMIEFDAPVKEVVVGWFDPNFEGNLMQAFDADGVLIDEAAVDLGPIGGLSAAWIGFVHEVADIKSVRFVDPSGEDVYAIDNVQTVVPAPGAGLGLAFAGAAALRRRR